MDMSRILQDAELKEEIMDKLVSGGLPAPFTSSVTSARMRSIVESAGRDLPVSGSEEESIIRLFGRPVLLIQDDAFAKPQSEVWHSRLGDARQQIERAIPSVGRVEIKNNPTYEWGGTAWLVAEDIIVTNRHVAELFARRHADSFVFRKNFDGKRMAGRVDFREEYRRPDEVEFKFTDILHIEEGDGPDIALFRVDVSGAQHRQRIQLSASTNETDRVAVIGYPARDSRIPDPAVMRDIFGNIYNVKRLAPGAVMSVDDTVLQHDCSTLGGNSGSVVLNINTGEAVGLHFAGRYQTANYAVPAPTVAARLSRFV